MLHFSFFNYVIWRFIRCFGIITTREAVGTGFALVLGRMTNIEI